MAFKQTDLPVPVRPAISRWGISARSKTRGWPLTSLPRNSGMRHSWNRPCDPGDHVAQPDHVAVVVGHLDADRRLARDRRHDPDARHGQGDRQVVGQAHDLRDAQAGLELDLELGDHRAGIDLHDADLVAEIQQGPLQQHGPGVDLGLVLLDREGRRGLEHFHRRQLRTASRAARRRPGSSARVGRADADDRAARRWPRSEADGSSPATPLHRDRRMGTASRRWRSPDRPGSAGSSQSPGSCAHQPARARGTAGGRARRPAPPAAGASRGPPGPARRTARRGRAPGRKARPRRG